MIRGQISNDDFWVIRRLTYLKLSLPHTESNVIWMELDSIAPWGRSHEEYIKMFSLSEEDIAKSILGCGDGPSSFNCSLTKLGGNITSLDPIYEFSKEQIKDRIELTRELVISQMRLNQGQYRWEHIRSVDDLASIRMKSMGLCLEDYGKADGRYLSFELPGRLPFGIKQFELALSSHFLLLYSKQLSFDFHLLSINEVMRVAKEFRIFPVLSLDGSQCSFLGDLMHHYKTKGFTVNLQKVDYEFQIGGNEMLVIQR